ncbi:MAG: hypothetical protein HQ503_16675 [Rhodospirillales bacterium]|nr:hypothetical protein [Rhodospirillales bacterium]
MLANLNREEFIKLLRKLGDVEDQDVLTAARDLHARITVAGIDWNNLLVPEETKETDEPDEEADDEEYDQDDAADEPEEEPDDDDDGSDEDETPLTDDEKGEAEKLIAAIGALEISEATREDVKEYKNDLKEGEFERMDLEYLRALRARLGK